MRSPPGPAMRCLPTMRSMRFAADLKSSPRDAVAELAKRLNYYRARPALLILSDLAQRSGECDAPPYKRAFLEADPGWGEPSLLAGPSSSTLPAFTDFYLLAAHRPAARRSGQYRRGAAGNRGLSSPFSIRTFAISALRHADLPAARLSAGRPHRDGAVADRQHPAPPRAAAVLDFSPGAHHRLGRAAADQRRRQLGPGLAWRHSARSG